MQCLPDDVTVRMSACMKSKGILGEDREDVILPTGDVLVQVKIIFLKIKRKTNLKGRHQKEKEYESGRIIREVTFSLK